MKKIITVTILLLSVNAADAQVTSAATQTAKLNLSNAIELSFTGSSGVSGITVNMAFNTVNDYANGITSPAQELVVHSNKNFSITVKTSATNFSYSGTTTPSPVMPVRNVLTLKMASNNTGGKLASPFSTTSYKSLASSNQNLITNGSKGGGQTFSVIYRATPGFSYPAGTYTANVIYTATQL